MRTRPAGVLAVAETAPALNRVCGVFLAGLFGDDASDAGAAFRSSDQFDAGAAPITEWLSGIAAAWTEVLAALTPAERATIVATMRACEAALDEHATARIAE